jgi:hypothetical protein
MGLDQTALIASTVDKWVESKFIDNVSGRAPLLAWFQEADRIKDWDGAGVKINEPVLKKYDVDRVQAIQGYDEIDLSPEDGEDIAQFNPKRLVIPILISEDELEANSGEEARINLLEAKFEQAELEMGDKFEALLYGDGSEYGGKAILGLDAIIPTDPDAGTIAGFDRSTNAWWCANSKSGAKSLDAYDKLRKAMANMCNTCRRGKIRTELILTTQDIFEAYEDLAFGKTLFQDTKSADLGFENFKFKSAVLSFADDGNIAAGDMYFINRWALRLRSRYGKKLFKTGPMVDLEKNTGKVLAFAKNIKFRGALTFNSPRTLGKLYSIS